MDEIIENKTIPKENNVAAPKDFYIDYWSYIVEGEDFVVNQYLTIHNPTVGEIKKIGELNFLRLIRLLTMRPYDCMVDLDDAKLNYKDYTDFDMFIRYLPVIENDLSKILFGDIDFTKFKVVFDNNVCKPFLTDGIIKIDESIYTIIMSYLRAVNFLSTEIEYDVANEMGRRELIKKTRRKIKKESNIAFESRLGNIISFVINECKIYNYFTYKEMKISQLYDSYFRSNHIQDYRQTMAGVYAGVVKYKDLDKTKLDWAGKITKA